MPEKRIIILFFACFFLTVALPAWACDSSCPITHRKGHLAPWEVLVEKSFGIPAGFGKALMTEDEWGEQKMLMSGMSSKERDEHKRKMKSVLIGKAEKLGITIPAIGRKTVFKKEKVMPFEYRGVNDNTARLP